LVTALHQGTAIIVYTYVKARAANYTAELDGVSTFVQLDSTSVNTTTPSATWGQLEDKEHTLVLRKERNDPSWRSNVPGNDLTYLSLDYFQ
jgi:putative heme degradation protein